MPAAKTVSIDVSASTSLEGYRAGATGSPVWAGLPTSST